MEVIYSDKRRYNREILRKRLSRNMLFGNIMILVVERSDDE